MPAPRTAFLSVYDKTHLADFAQQLVVRFNYQLVATGGTRKHLLEAGLDVQELGQVTGFEQLLQGRVKSLHPSVFAGILARGEADAAELAKHPDIAPWLFDLVVANLYPFEAGLALADTDPDQQVELIDIGGCALLRAAAKNFNRVTVVSSPSYYEPVLVDMVANGGQTRLPLRQLLARDAFKRCSTYDAAISAWLDGVTQTPDAGLPATLQLTLYQAQPMRYGENPHQPAALYTTNPKGQLPYTLLQGKPLSYNNLLDTEAAWGLMSEFADMPTVAIIKHTTPCGVAQATTLAKAFNNALGADPLSAFGGIVALNRPVDADVAEALTSLFLEVVVAPAFTQEALAVLAKKKNLRVIERHLPTSDANGEPTHPATLQNGTRLRQLNAELFLAQHYDYASTEAKLGTEIKVVTKAKPTEEQLKDLAFAWRVAKHVKSNAIVLARNGKTLGISGGQTSRVGALEQAVAAACDEANDACLASDGFFPAVDNIHVAAQNRVGAIIQPGGSIKDPEVIAACDKYGIVMVTTGVREFRH